MLTDDKRWRAVPDVQDAREAGLPAVQVITWNGVLATGRRCPRPIVERLHQAIVKAMGAPDMKDRMTALASEATTTHARAVRRMLREGLRALAESDHHGETRTRARND